MRSLYSLKKQISLVLLFLFTSLYVFAGEVELVKLNPPLDKGSNKLGCDGYEISDILRSAKENQPMALVDSENVTQALVIKYNNSLILKSNPLEEFCLKGSFSLPLILEVGHITFQDFSSPSTVQIRSADPSKYKSNELNIRANSKSQFTNLQIEGMEVLTKGFISSSNSINIKSTTEYNNKGILSSPNIFLNVNKGEIKRKAKIDAGEILSIQAKKTFYVDDGGVVLSRTVTYAQGNFNLYGGSKLITPGVCFFDTNSFSVTGELYCNRAIIQNKGSTLVSGKINANYIFLSGETELLVSGTLYQGYNAADSAYKSEKNIPSVPNIKIPKDEKFAKLLKDASFTTGIVLSSTRVIKTLPSANIGADKNVTYNAPRLDLKGKTSTGKYSDSCIQFLAKEQSIIEGEISSGNKIEISAPSTKIAGMMSAVGDIFTFGQKLETTGTASLKANSVKLFSKFSTIDGEVFAEKSIHSDGDTLLMKGKTNAPKQTYETSNNASFGFMAQQVGQNITVDSQGKTEFYGMVDTDQLTSSSKKSTVLGYNSQTTANDATLTSDKKLKSSAQSTLKGNTATLFSDGDSQLDGHYTQSSSFQATSNQKMTFGGQADGDGSKNLTANNLVVTKDSSTKGSSTTFTGTKSASIQGNHEGSDSIKVGSNGTSETNAKLKAPQIQITGDSIKVGDRNDMRGKTGTLQSSKDIDLDGLFNFESDLTAIGKKGTLNYRAEGESGKTTLTAQNINHAERSSLTSTGPVSETAGNKLTFQKNTTVTSGSGQSNLSAKEIELQERAKIDSKDLDMKGSSLTMKENSQVKADELLSSSFDTITTKKDSYQSANQIFTSVTKSADLQGDSQSKQKSVVDGKKTANITLSGNNQTEGVQVIRGKTVHQTKESQIGGNTNIVEAEQDALIEGSMKGMNQKVQSNEGNVQFTKSSTTNSTDSTYVVANKGQATFAGNTKAGELLQVDAKKTLVQSTADTRVKGNMLVTGDSYESEDKSFTNAGDIDLQLKKTAKLGGYTNADNRLHVKADEGISVKKDAQVLSKEGHLEGGKYQQEIGSQVFGYDKVDVKSKTTADIDGDLLSHNQKTSVDAKEISIGERGSVASDGDTSLKGKKITNSGKIRAGQFLDIDSEEFRQSLAGHMGFQNAQLTSKHIYIDGTVQGEEKFYLTGEDGEIHAKIESNEAVLEIPVLDFGEDAEIDSKKTSITADQKLSLKGKVHGAEEIYIKVNDDYVPAGYLSSGGWIKFAGKFNSDQCNRIIHGENGHFQAKGFGVETDQKVSLTDNLNFENSIDVKAPELEVKKSIHAKGALKLESTEKDLNLGPIDLHADRELELRTGGNLDCTGTYIEGQMTSIYVKKDIIQKYYGSGSSAHGSVIKNHGQGNIIQTMITERDENGKVIYDEKNKPKYKQQEIEVGIYIQAGGKFQNIASTINAKGSAIIDAHGIEITPNTYITEESSTHKKWNKKTTTKTTVGHCDGSDITAEDGYLLLNANEGEINATAANLKGSKGTQLRAEKGVHFYDVITNVTTETKKRGFLTEGQILCKENVMRSDNIAVVSSIIDNTSIAVDTNGDFYARGTVIATPGQLSVRADKGVKLDVSKLDHRVRVDRKTVGPAGGGYDLAKLIYNLGTAKNTKERGKILSEADPLVQQYLVTLKSMKNGDELDTLINGGSAAYQTVSEIQSLLSKGPLDYLAQKYGSVGLGYGHSQTDMKWQTQGEGQVFCGNLDFRTDKEHDVVFDNGIPVVVEETKDRNGNPIQDGSAYIKTRNFVQKGIKLESSSTSSQESVSVTKNFAQGNNGGICDVNLSESNQHQSATNWGNQQFVVRNKFTIFADNWDIDAGNVTAGQLEGNVKNLNIKSELDTQYQKSHSYGLTVTVYPGGVPVPTAANMGGGNFSSETIRQMSGIKILRPNETGKFVVEDTTHLKGAFIDTPDDFHSKKIVAEDIQTSSGGSSFNVGFNASTGNGNASFQEAPSKTEVFRASIITRGNSKIVAEETEGEINQDPNRVHEVLSESKGRDVRFILPVGDMQRYAEKKRLDEEEQKRKQQAENEAKKKQLQEEFLKKAEAEKEKKKAEEQKQLEPENKTKKSEDKKEKGSDKGKIESEPTKKQPVVGTQDKEKKKPQSNESSENKDKSDSKKDRKDDSSSNPKSDKIPTIKGKNDIADKDKFSNKALADKLLSALKDNPNALGKDSELTVENISKLYTQITGNKVSKEDLIILKDLERKISSEIYIRLKAKDDNLQESPVGIDDLAQFMVPGAKAVCFPGETLISVWSEKENDFIFMPIESVNEGDFVRSCNLKTQVCETKQVEQIQSRDAQELYIIKVGDEVIRVTPEHPFYIVNILENGPSDKNHPDYYKNSKWIKAKKLTPGMLLRTHSNELLKIDEIHHEEGNFIVYNLQVSVNKNYYVSKKGFLVHNCALGKKALIMSAILPTFEKMIAKKATQEGEKLLTKEAVQIGEQLFNKGLENKVEQHVIKDVEAKVANSVGKAGRLVPQKIRNYLSNVDNIPRSELIKDMESIGLKVKGQSPDGRFMEFIDKNGIVRAKIHPPDKVTTYHHLHIYDSSENPLSSLLKQVAKDSPDAHINIGGN